MFGVRENGNNEGGIKLAKLEIKGDKSTIHGIKILVDGREMRHITELGLTLEVKKLNTASITFFVDDIDVDADVMTRLNAILREKSKKEPKDVGELSIKAKADTEEYDKATGRVIKWAKREGALPRLPHIFWEE